MYEAITSELLEESHTAADYLTWVKSMINCFKEVDPKGLEKIRLRKGLAKNLMEESLIIGKFAKSYFDSSNEVQISLKIGSQSFDATVTDKRDIPSKICYLEVTLASQNESEFLRMTILHATGEVSGTGKIKKIGSGKNRKIEVENNGISQEEILIKERQSIIDAIERKLKKQYPENTALIIGFDDTFAHDRQENINNLTTTVLNYAKQLSAFNCLAIIGTVKDLYLKFDQLN